jgi:hypothetical protein
VDGTSPGAHLQLNFPPAANAGEQRLTYWLTGTEDMQVEYDLGLGPASGYPDSVTVYTSLILDKSPIALDAAGNLVQSAKLTIGSTTTSTVTISHDMISDGAHSATLLSWESEGRTWGSWSFTVLKNGYNFAAIAPEGAPAPGDAPIGVFDQPTARPIYGQYQPAADGTIHATANLVPALQGCAGAVYNLALVAMLDDHPIQFGGAYMHIARAKAGGGQTLAFDVSGLPVSDGAKHYLSFWMLTGIGQYAEAPLGAVSPWHDTDHRLAIGIWGP